MPLSYDDFLKAQRDLNNITVVTPLVESPFLSNLIEGKVFLKLENMQLTHSFFVRGAYIKLASLTKEEQKRGIIIASLGNYALAMGYFGKRMGIPTRIIVPNKITPPGKMSALDFIGVNVEYYGNTLEQAMEKANAIAKNRNMTFINPYEDRHIIMGQGTMGIELIEQHRQPFDSLIIPIGGGSLAAGVGRVLSSRWPTCDIFGVQSEFSPYMAEKLFLYRSSAPKLQTTIAEGLAVQQSSEYTDKILKDVLADIFVVTEKSIMHAIQHLFFKEKQIVEGAGAAGVAALIENKHAFQKKTVGIIVCGGNIDSELLINTLREDFDEQNIFPVKVIK